MMSTHLKGDLYKCPESLGIGAPRETGPAVRRPLHSADEIVKNVAGGSQTFVGEQEIAHPAISAVHTLRNLIEVMQCEVRISFFPSSIYGIYVPRSLLSVLCCRFGGQVPRTPRSQKQTECEPRLSEEQQRVLYVMSDTSKTSGREWKTQQLMRTDTFQDLSNISL